jgi:hypothetical protein
MIRPVNQRYVRSSVAAKAVGVSKATLVRWANDPKKPVHPAWVTPGDRPQYMWDLSELRRQLGIPEPPEDDDD